MKTFKNKNVWIIGASSGIGAALAKNLAAQGANVILSARREDELEKIKSDLACGQHSVLPLDVTDPARIDQHIKTIQKEYDSLDSVIFLAAIYSRHDGKPKDIDFIQKMIAVNLGGGFNVAEKVKPAFLGQGFGQLVLCASVAGYRGLPKGQPYCATKAGLINYAESLHVEWKADGLDVKVICPGFVETPLTDKNDFEMPMIITADKAAEYIAQGLIKKSFEIHFPKRFSFMMKALRIMPNFLYFKLAEQINAKAEQSGQKDLV